MASKRRQEATPDEFKALAHPLRLRILRLCLHDSLTNKQIADQLEKDPATVLHHVRMLVDTGFLRAGSPRSGTRGALEKPYRATGKSWRLSVERFPADRRLTGLLAMIDAFRAEVAEAGADHEVSSARLGLKLNQRSMEELRDRMMAIVQDFADRPDDPDGEAYGLYLGIHKRGARP